MRDYQRQKNNKYILPIDAYNQTLWIIRGYDRLKDEADAIIKESPPPPDGQPSGNVKLGSIVESKAMKRESPLYKVAVIDYAFSMIPEEYRKGVWNNIQTHEPYPQDADRSTYARWKSKTIYYIAKTFELI